MMLHRSFLTPRILLLTMMICVGAIYALHSDGELMFDDELEINLVKGYHSVSETFSVDCFELFRPVKNLIFYAWTNIWPDNIQIWRLSAIVAFIGLIPFVYRFFGIFFPENPWIRLICTTIWASAPALTTVVSWISSTNIIISGYGFFAYFLLYEKGHKDLVQGKIYHACTWYFLSIFSLALSCFSYEAAMSAPLLLLYKDYTNQPERLKQSRARIFFTSSFIIIAVYLLLRKFYGGANSIDFSLSMPTDSTLWVSLSSGWFYIVHAVRWIWPFGHQGLSIIFTPESHKTLVLVSVVFVVGLGVTMLWFRKRYSKLIFGLVWYAVALFPMANVVPLKNGPICDYYLFFPSLGLLLTLSEGYKILQGSKYKNLITALSIIWIVGFLATTWTWVPHWKTKKDLAQRTLEWQPTNYVMLAFLAEESLLSKDLSSAQSYLDRALTAAPAEPKYRYNIEYLNSLWLGMSGRYGESAAALESIIDSYQQNHAAVPVLYQTQLAYIYDVRLDQTQKAEKHLISALDSPWDDSFSKAAALRLVDIYVKTDRTVLVLEMLQFWISQHPRDQDFITRHSSIKEEFGRRNNSSLEFQNGPLNSEALSSDIKSDPE